MYLYLEPFVFVFVYTAVAGAILAEFCAWTGGSARLRSRIAVSAAAGCEAETVANFACLNFSADNTDTYFQLSSIQIPDNPDYFALNRI